MSDRRVLRVTGGGRVEYYGQVGSGHKKIGLKAPDALAADYTLTLPLVTGAVGSSLSTDGSGNLIFGGFVVINVKSYGATGDGSTNDTAAIVAAIAAIPATGGVLYFPPGTYMVDRNSLILTTSKVTIQGAGGAILKSRSGSGNSSVVLTIGANGTNLTDIRIFGLEIDGNRTNWTISAATQSHNIAIRQAQRVWIENCYIHDSAGDGIKLDTVAGGMCHHVHIEGNYIDVCARNGITIAGSHVKVLDNEIFNWSTMGIVSEPGASETCFQVSIEGNILKPSDTRLNTFNDNRIYGIAFKNGTSNSDSIARVVVSNNQIYGVTDTAVQYPDVGIYFDDFRGAECLGNFVYQANTAIVVVGSSGTDPTEVIVDGNHIRDCKHIGIQAAAKCQVNNNHIYLCNSNGILLAFANITCLGNIIRNCGTDSGATLTDAQQSGILVQDDTCIIMGNRIFDDRTPKLQPYGIYLDTDADDNIVRDNIVAGNLTAGILEVTTDNKVSRNIGFTTENSGLATVLNGTTSIAVTHGLAITPAIANIVATMAEDSTNDPVKFWISTVTSTEFTINVKADPGASNLDFNWQITPRV